MTKDNKNTSRFKPTLGTVVYFSLSWIVLVNLFQKIVDHKIN